jgi:hypothetical protein
VILIFWIFIASAVLVQLRVVMEIIGRLWLRYDGEYYVWPRGSRLQLRPDSDVISGLEPLVRVEINQDGERGDQVRTSQKGLY